MIQLAPTAVPQALARCRGVSETPQVTAYGWGFGTRTLQGDPTSFAVPTLSVGASGAAIQWWTSRLNELFGVLTDLAVFTDQNGDYHPIKHLHSRMTVEQLFRRVNSIQTARRDVNARRVLLFAALDTLERLTGQPPRTALPAPVRPAKARHIARRHTC